VRWDDSADGRIAYPELADLEPAQPGMAPVGPGYPPTQTLLLGLTLRDAADDVNCALCLEDGPEWTFSFRARVSAARVTSGLCEACRVMLQSGTTEKGGK
jgi:hypothetical protein